MNENLAGFVLFFGWLALMIWFGDEMGIRADFNSVNVL